MFTLFLLSACQQPEATTETKTITETVTVTAYAWYPDRDLDGFGDATAEPLIAPEADDQVAHVTNNADCDDTAIDVHPGAIEACNNADDDCNGSIDDAANDEATWFLDADGDSFGDAKVEIASCDPDAPNHFVADNTDCDDADAEVYPTAPEFCDQVDNNCDGSVDENSIDAWTWSPDADGDGSSTSAEDAELIVACLESKPTGYNSNRDDCDDTNAAIGPDADELCDDVDNDCDGSVDEDAVDAPTWYGDYDLDGYGDMYGWYFTPIRSCEAPSIDYIPVGGDCDDGWDWVYPGAEETCDWTDNDCDTFMDDDDPEGVSGTSTWYADQDYDGYGGTLVVATDACEYGAWMALGMATYTISANSDDCYDDPYDPAAWDINPGVDDDGDGYDACEDCDEDDDDNYPGADEVTGDDEDNDCDGTVN